MKIIWALALLLITNYTCFSQNQQTSLPSQKKGEFYIYWGWNISGYSHSDIHFKGVDYDFTLDDVVAKHRPTKLSVDNYLNPLDITIPQYDFRIGYFIKDDLNISFGFDHMKYVVQRDQHVEISGHIDDPATGFAGVYDHNDISIVEDFLKLEHTDGLNYLNIELRRMKELYARKNLSLNRVEGVGAGLMFPRTDATLLNNRRHDKFHVAGYGMAGVVGLNAAIRKHFFIQTELKGGFINMPWIRTTENRVDEASQHFFFYQLNIVFGSTINFRKN
jgi:hypothetical protein